MKTIGLLLALALPLFLAASAVAAPPTGGCRLGTSHERIEHVIYIQFDNTHLRRDIPGVPSDLEPMMGL